VDRFRVTEKTLEVLHEVVGTNVDLSVGLLLVVGRQERLWMLLLRRRTRFEADQRRMGRKE
jgi:hypothetical protein